MTKQSPFDGKAESARSESLVARRRSSVRAMLGQGTVALLALVGGIWVADLGGTPDSRPVATRLAAREASARAPFRRVRSEPTTVELAARFRLQGYDVPAELAETIAAAAQRHGIGREVAFGLVRTESGFRNHATSRVGAVGLAQLMPRTAAWIKPGTTVRQLRDPAHNVEVGFTYLRTLIDRYDGDVSMALLAYNRGPGTVDRIVKRGGNPDNGYADAVMKGSAHGG